MNVFNSDDGDDVTVPSLYSMEGPTSQEQNCTVTRMFVNKKLFSKLKFITDKTDLEYRGTFVNDATAFLILLVTALSYNVLLLSLMVVVHQVIDV